MQIRAIVSVASGPVLPAELRVCEETLAKKDEYRSRVRFDG
jgi:hypothetical protein